MSVYSILDAIDREADMRQTGNISASDAKIPVKLSNQYVTVYLNLDGIGVFGECKPNNKGVFLLMVLSILFVE